MSLEIEIEDSRIKDSDLSNKVQVQEGDATVTYEVSVHNLHHTQTFSPGGLILHEGIYGTVRFSRVDANTRLASKFNFLPSWSKIVLGLCVEEEFLYTIESTVEGRDPPLSVTFSWFNNYRGNIIDKATQRHIGIPPTDTLDQLFHPIALHVMEVYQRTKHTVGKTVHDNYMPVSNLK